MKYFFFFLTIIIFLFESCRGSRPDSAALTEAIESKNFVFQAQTIIASGTAQRQINTGEYSLELLQDSISVLLPFFGRAFNASPGMTGGPIQLNTKDFEYSSEKKNDRWEVRITPSNTSQVRQMFLSISGNGYANLQVISTNRESISFNGVIELKKNKSR
jgi:hypothetical protein